MKSPEMWEAEIEEGKHNGLSASALIQMVQQDLLGGVMLELRCANFCDSSDEDALEVCSVLSAARKRLWEAFGR